MSATSQGVTIEVDGVNYTTLSAAVAAAQAAEDGPDIININVASLPTADGQIHINQPLVINGNANNRPEPNDKCDLLVDVTGIKAATDIGEVRKCYIEMQADGQIILNDLKIHPNEDGVVSGGNVVRVDGIRMYPAAAETANGDYVLNRVWVSGSDADNNYVNLDTGDDLYNMAGVKRWSWGGASPNASNAVIQLATGGVALLGSYSATLNDCHAGLGHSSAINIPAGFGTYTINGGLFGHVARDGIRISGDNVTVKGTATNRVRIIRATNESGTNAHPVEIESTGSHPLLEYIDSSSLNTGNCFVIRGNAHVGTMRFCRAIGNYGAVGAVNATFFLGVNATVDTIEDCTFVGDLSFPTPLQFAPTFDGAVAFTDSIFTSTNFGQVLNQKADTSGTASFTNCALPTDNFAGESLADPPIVTDTAGAEPTVTNAISVSPMYLLTKEDYDWSEAQGAGNPLNGPGNTNVLRPSNTAYTTASSTGGPLTGGAGPDLSSIDASVWMLME